jgi:hypothetical protein
MKQYFMTQQGQALPGYCISLALVIQSTILNDCKKLKDYPPFT